MKARYRFRKNKILKEDPDYFNRRSRGYRRQNPERYLWRLAKSRALRSGIPFDLTPEDIHIPKKCPVLGIPLFISDDGRQCDNSPSVERLRPEKDYVVPNITVISWRANYLRKNATLDELKKLVKFYAKHLK